MLVCGFFFYNVLLFLFLLRLYSSFTSFSFCCLLSWFHPHRLLLSFDCIYERINAGCHCYFANTWCFDVHALQLASSTFFFFFEVAVVVCALFWFLVRHFCIHAHMFGNERLLCVYKPITFHILSFFVLFWFCYSYKCWMLWPPHICTFLTLTHAHSLFISSEYLWPVAMCALDCVEQNEAAH